jgi:MFS family permease
VGDALWGENDNSCGDSRPWYMLISRAVVGFGAGSMAVCMAYVSGATTLAERGAQMGLLAATGGLGFIFGPLVGYVIAFC